MSSTADPRQQPSDFSGISAGDLERTEIRSDGIYSVEPSPGRGTAPGESVYELVGQNLDHYRIESLVGIGGMGAVFRGRDLRLDRVVAIKVVPMANRRAEAMRRFRMEAQSAAKLDHPNIARVHYVGETDRWSYIVFEFIEGTNLRQLVLEHGPLTVDDATHFVCQVAEALQHAHERGVVHRDIKPSNILIGKDGRAKIVDMGLARTTELDRSTGDLTASGVTLGTFDYISPEQAHDPRDVDVRSDIYSLGCTLYFLLTGQPPFPEGTALQKLLMHGTKMPEDPRCFRNDVTDALIAILRKMMAKKPKDRYQEPVDLVNDLRTLAVIDSLAWREELQEEPVGSPPSHRSWWEFALPAVVCAAVIAMVTLWLYNANQLSAVYVIPRVEIPEFIAIDSAKSDAIADTPSTLTNAAMVVAAAPPTTAPPVIEPPARNSRANVQKPIALIVVDNATTDLSFMPEPFEAVPSLDDALSRWSTESSVQRIVLAVPSVSVQRPIVLGRSNDRSSLRIESAPNLRVRVAISDAVARSGGETMAGWFNLDVVDCEIRDLDLEWNATVIEGRPQSLFALVSGSRLSLHNATVTVRAPSSNRLPGIVRFESASPAAEPVAIKTSAVTLDRSCLRGQCDAFQIESSDRVELHLENCWTAISGSMIDLEGARTLNRSPRIRSELTHVTSITLNPWLRIRMSTANPFPVAFVRVANESIFSGSSTLVEWDASNVSEWPFASQAKRIEDLGRWIDLRGLDNVYDIPSIVKLVQVIMSMSSEEVAIDSDSNLLRNERGMELVAAWQSGPKIDATKMHIQNPRAAQWTHLGLTRGARLDTLPVFPGSPASP